jgi:hypothetical protein
MCAQVATFLDASHGHNSDWLKPTTKTYSTFHSGGTWPQSVYPMNFMPLVRGLLYVCSKYNKVDVYMEGV